MTSRSHFRRPPRPACLEVLESRIAPATLVSLDPATHKLTVQGDYVDDGSSVVQAGASEALAFSVSNGFLLITDALHHVTAVGSAVLQTGSGQVSVPITSLDGDVAIQTGTGTDTLDFSDAILLAANHSLTAHTTGTITIEASSTLSAIGTGALSLTTTRDISIAAGANLKVADGNLSLTATGAVSGNYSGISVGGSIFSSGLGSILLAGHGGDTGSSNFGLHLHGQISAAGSGVIVLQGQGGVGGVDANSGVVAPSGTITGGKGGITFRGTPGTDAGASFGIDLGIAFTSAGDVHFETDKGLLFEAAASVNAGTATVFLQPVTAATGMSLGTAPQAAFGVSDAMLGAITAGTVVVGSAQAGAFSLDAGISSSNSLDLKSGSTLTGANAITLAAGKDLSIETGGLISLTGAVTVPGVLSLTGVGTDLDMALLSAVNDLNIVHVANGANVALRDLNGFSLDAHASKLLTLNSGGTITQLGAITGGGDLLKEGTGTLALSFANAIGKTTISGGAITFSDPGAFGTGTITLGDANTLSNNVALLNAGKNVSLANDIVVPNLGGPSVATIGSVAVASGVSNFSGALDLNRATTFNAGNPGTTSLTGASAGSLNAVVVTGGGTLEVGDVGGFTVHVTGTGTILKIVSGGDTTPSNVMLDDTTTLLLAGDGSPEIVDSLTGLGTVAATNGSQTLTIGAAGSTFQFDGTFQDGTGSLSLTKAGAGKATLTNTHTYTGTTTIAGGTLALVNTDFDNPIPSSAEIDVQAGATLDVTGLTPGNDPQTLSLLSSQILLGSGTLVGNLAGAGTVAPGGFNNPGVLTISGNFQPGDQVVFDVRDPYTTAGTDFDQIVVGGTVNLSAAKLRFFGGGNAPTPGQTVTLISNTGGSATVPSTDLAEGATLFAGNAPFTIGYNAGAGHDVVLTPATGQVDLSATLVGGKLTVSNNSATGQPSHLSVFVSLGTELVVNDDLGFFAAAPAGGTLGNGNHGFSLPLGKVTKGVVVNGGAGDDTLVLDLTATPGIPPPKLPAGGVIFNGGAQATSLGDQLLILGGAQGVVTYSYNGSDSTAGGVSTTAAGSVNYTGLEAVLNNGAATNVIFNLPPADQNGPTLASDFGQGSGLTRLSAFNLTTVEFVAPTGDPRMGGAGGTVTINRNSAIDFVNLGDLSGFNAGITIGSAANPFDHLSVNTSLDLQRPLNVFASHLSLAAGLSVSAVSGSLVLGDGAISGSIDGGLSLTKTASVSGIPLLLNGVDSYTGGTFVLGPLTLGNALAAENSTIHIGSSFALGFASAIGTFTIGGLAGTGDLPLQDASNEPVTLLVGQNDSTYAGSLSGPGTLHKVGAGTLTLTGHNAEQQTVLESGVLQINSDFALGLMQDVPLAVDGGTLRAIATFTSSRNIFMQGAGTFEASPGKTLTLAGQIAGPGDFLIGDTGTVLVTGQSNTISGSQELGAGPSETVNGVTISSPGIHSGIVVTPGAAPGDIAAIDLTGVNVPVSLVIKSPTGTATEVIERIISTDNTPIKMISLGAHVTLGNGVADLLPDLQVNGKLTTLNLSDVSANSLIELGKGLAYKDTYKNAPNVTLNNVLGAGVVLDVTGNGVSGILGGVGGGGLGKVVVNSWTMPGLIKTSQSIKSLTVKTGNSDVSLQVDPNHLGTLTTGNVGLISVPNGQWAGAGMQVEGTVAQFLTKGIVNGSALSAGAFGTINIKGDFAGSITATFASSTINGKTTITGTGAIGNVTISSGDFTGLINADGKVGNVTLVGSANFMGSLRGLSIGNITAASFTGTPGLDGVRKTITATRTIGNITAGGGGLTDYLIAAGADLGSDALVGGLDTYASFYYSTPTAKLPTAVSIGAITIQGTVSGTTIAAGVNPGTGGLYGDGNDSVTTPPTGYTGKSKIGALIFDTGSGTSSLLGFTGMPADAVSNAFEAQAMTSVKFGTGAAVATNQQYRKTFTDPTYIDSGGSSIIVRLVS